MVGFFGGEQNMQMRCGSSYETCSSPLLSLLPFLGRKKNESAQLDGSNIAVLFQAKRSVCRTSHARQQPFSAVPLTFTPAAALQRPYNHQIQRASPRSSHHAPIPVCSPHPHPPTTSFCTHSQPQTPWPRYTTALPGSSVRNRHSERPNIVSKSPTKAKRQLPTRTHLKHRHRPRPQQIPRPYRTPIPRLMRQQLPVRPVGLLVLGPTDLERRVRAARPETDGAAQVDAREVAAGRRVLGEVVDEGQARRHLARDAGGRERVEREDPGRDGDATGLAEEGSGRAGGFGGLDVAGFSVGQKCVSGEEWEMGRTGLWGVLVTPARAVGSTTFSRIADRCKQSVGMMDDMERRKYGKVKVETYIFSVASARNIIRIVDRLHGQMVRHAGSWQERTLKIPAEPFVLPHILDAIADCFAYTWRQSREVIERPGVLKGRVDVAADGGKGAETREDGEINNGVVDACCRSRASRLLPGLS
ncbi:hypothetical protein MPH_12077 [Macrophomina phaseolina MS6]|uniref:Uncharacterized protein n=1 Tax=Macrophomina phaseolina (strain MS6) TaxID=1126212 RepID=K2QLS2_MACPH|nr:hypothetical protein MPH_12077 [Macrophomina phaseolina MS6]